MFIKWFKDINKDDIPIAGGKGASLGEMLNAGIPVPNGFVILADAFEKFINETGLDVEIDAALDSVKLKDIATVEFASEKIKNLIIQAEMPKEIEDEIKKAFDKLNARFVAVRSSATAEDSKIAAWAGQLETYLNTTKKDLIDNVKKCWASLFTPRAIVYRFEKGLHKQRISVAVVVQKMVQSEKSGVAFSVHPVTQDENQLIIEACYGLGEALVSGQITPDSYVVEKKPRRIIDKKIEVQTKGIYKTRKGNEWKSIPEAKGKKQVLSDKDILKLAEIIIKIEKHYGFPVDVEWAYEKGKFYILQSRAITTLEKNKTKYKEDIIIINDKRVKLADRFIRITQKQELFPTISGNICIFAPHLSAWGFGSFYRDASLSPYMVAMKKGKNFTIISAEGIKTAAEAAFKRYWKEPKYLMKNRRLIRYYLKILKKVYLTYSYDKISKTNLDDLKNIAKQVILANKYLNTFALFPTIFFDKDFCREILAKLDININKDRFEEIWKKATVPVYGSFEKRRYLNLLELIVKRMGWRDIAERCQYYFANYNSIENIQEVERKLRKQYGNISIKQAKRIIKDEVKKKNKTISLYNNWLKTLNKDERKLAIYIQEMIRVRDVRKDGVSWALTIIYRIAQRIFKEVGLDEDLIYYCSSEEISKGIKYFIENRENIKKRPQGVVMLFFYNKNTPTEFEYGIYNETVRKLKKYYLAKNLLKEVAQKKIKGQIAFPGKVRGLVRIVNDPKITSNFRKGNILVTSMTRPEFVPLIKKSGAIITDEGGITSHAAIVSREMRIPCVVGTKIATQVLKDGDLVEIDGEKGIIKILKRAKQK